MNIEIFTLLTIVSAMVILFLSDKIPIDLTAFIGLIAITLCGYITTEEAFSGFSSSAVITMLCTFFVAAALNETGVTEFLGTKVEQLVGSQELTVVSTVMLLGVVISAFLPNVPTVAVLMPVVASISRRTGIAPSRLYLPMCFAVILGGSVTLIGCTPNIIAAEILQKSGYTPFQLFDFSLVAGSATACC